MSDIADRWAIPALTLLADWSLRWAIVLAALMIWFALRPPRRPAMRHSLCLAALLAGLSLPILPRWINAPVRWPFPAPRAAATTARPISTEMPRITRLPEHDRAHTPLAQLADHGIVKTVAQSQAHPHMRALNGWQFLALAAALFWLAAALVQICRLIAGRVILARLRHTAEPLDEQASLLLEECRRALNVTRHVGLAQHPAIASPIMLGGRRPLVLVPEGWESWPKTHRRACLTHELVHIARRDDWLKIIQELVRVPMFFHPLVHWLLARLDRERELVCDEGVIAQGTPPNAYARMLLDLAQRPGRILSGSLPFFDRGTVAARIKRLLEDDMPHAPAPSPTQRRLAFAAAAVITIGIGGLHINASESIRLHEQKTRQNKEAETTAPKAAERAIDGTVLDPDGNPVAGATIVAGIHSTGQPNHRVFQTNEKGQFHWALPAGQIFPSLMAYKQGFAPAGWWGWLDVDSGRDPVSIHLSTSEPFEATLVDTQGRPMAGATVRVEQSAHISPLVDHGNGHTSRGMCFSYVHSSIIAGSPLEHLFITTTDETGAFAFPTLWPSSGLRLDVTDAQGHRHRVKAARPNLESMAEQSGFVSGPPGASTQLIAFPAARVAGRVLSGLPEVDVSSLTVFYQDSGEPSPDGRPRNFSEDISVDAEGRFVIDGLSEGTINIIVNGSGSGQRWTYRAAKDVTLESGKTTDATITIIQGIDIEGTVIAKTTAKPVAGAAVAVYGPYRPRTSAMTQSAPTDAQGRYHFRLPPGETYLYVINVPSGFRPQYEEQSGSTWTGTIPEDVSRYEVPPLLLGPALTVSGRIIDSAGAPVPGATIMGRCLNTLYLAFGGKEIASDAQGAFQGLELPSSAVEFDDSDRFRIRLADGSEHEASITTSPNGTITVKLPAAEKQTAKDH